MALPSTEAYWPEDISAATDPPRGRIRVVLYRRSGVGKLSYPYKPYAGDGGSPSLEVTLLGTNGREHSTLALIDTGAEWSVLPTSLAVELGAELGSEFCRPTQTQHAGGMSAVHWWSGSGDGAERDELGVRFGDFEVPLAPVLEPGISVVVLGRTDFLASFLLAVDQRTQEFWLEPYEEPVSDWYARTQRVESALPGPTIASITTV